MGIPGWLSFLKPDEEISDAVNITSKQDTAEASAAPEGPDTQLQDIDTSDPSVTSELALQQDVLATQIQQLETKLEQNDDLRLGERQDKLEDELQNAQERLEDLEKPGLVRSGWNWL